jgi:hypothetical protein
MDSGKLKELCAKWINAKQAVTEAATSLETVEDQLIQLLNVDLLRDGTTQVIDGDVRIKVTSRPSRTVDDTKLKALAEEHDLKEHLSTLFRWKPEVNLRAWRGADKKIRKSLNDAITLTSARPAFAITITPDNAIFQD